MFEHPDCFARALGDCSKEISKEHYVSDSVLRAVSEGESSVFVQNLAFQERGILQRRGIGGLSTKMLCEKHNGDLTSFDVAGASLFLCHEEIERLVSQTAEEPEALEVEGDDLERWMLKMLFGGLYSGNFPVPGECLKGVPPPIEWLKILFRDEPFPDGQGLYLRTDHSEDAFSSGPSVLRMRTDVSAEVPDLVIGLTVWVFGFEYMLVLARLPTPLPENLEHAYYRPKKVTVHGSGKRILFNWKHGGEGEEVEYTATR